MESTTPDGHVSWASASSRQKGSIYIRWPAIELGRFSSHWWARTTSRPGLAVARRHESQFGDDFGSGQSVLCEASVRLKLQQAAQGVWPKDAVNVATVEAKRIELPLQLGDIVTAHHGNPVIEDPASQLESCAYERPPGIRADDPICP